MTAAEFERLTAAEVECLLRRRLNLFVNAGATPCAALVLAAQVEIPEEEAVCFLNSGSRSISHSGFCTSLPPKGGR